MTPRYFIGRSLLPALTLALLTPSCGLFRPASPQPPTGSAIVGRYVYPDTTLATLAVAVADKAQTNGQTVYMAGFADSTVDGVGFHAFFDPATVARFVSSHSAPDLNWSTRNEQNFYVKFVQIQPGAAYTFLWQPDTTSVSDDIEATTALIHRRYRVFATLAGSDSAVVLSRGYADLGFVKIGSDWKIVRWQDREDPLAHIDAGELSYGQRRLESQ